MGGDDDEAALDSAFAVLVDFGFARPLPDSLVVHAEFGGTPDFGSTRCACRLRGFWVGVREGIQAFCRSMLTSACSAGKHVHAGT